MMPGTRGICTTWHPGIPIDSTQSQIPFSSGLCCRDRRLRQAQSLGATVMRNLLAGDYAGTISRSTRSASVANAAVPDVGSLGPCANLAVICTAADATEIVDS